VAAPVAAGIVPQPVNPPTPATAKVIGLDASVVGAFVVDTVMVSPVPGATVAAPAMVVVAAGAAWTMVSEVDAPESASVAVMTQVPGVEGAV
jgi:hypothetical protein